MLKMKIFPLGHHITCWVTYLYTRLEFYEESMVIMVGDYPPCGLAQCGNDQNGT